MYALIEVVASNDEPEFEFEEPSAAVKLVCEDWLELDRPLPGAPAPCALWSQLERRWSSGWLKVPL